MGSGELRDAARAELAGYWTRVLRKRAIWLQDVYVDRALTVWARADATISDGVLITKTEAIDRMVERGVPPDVVDGVARRRKDHRSSSEDKRHERAVVVRQFLNDEFTRLLTDP